MTKILEEIFGDLLLFRLYAQNFFVRTDINKTRGILLHETPSTQKSLIARTVCDIRIHQIIPEDVQHNFTRWFNQLNPDLHRSKWSLQLAVEHLLRRWLDKRMAMANWGCGIDLSLQTFIPMHAHGKKKEKIIQDEKAYRELMVDYSMLDCMSVTELKTLIPTDAMEIPNQSEAVTVEEEQTNIDEMEDVIYSHPTENHETEFEVQENSSEIEQQHQVLTQTQGGLGMIEELLSSINVGFENESPPTRAGESCPERSASGDRRTRYDQSDIANSMPENKTRKQRNKRHRFQVIRKLCYRFDTTQVKNILIDMNIRWTNVDVKYHRLILSLHDSRTQRRVDRLLHEDIFTENHYHRIYRRHHRRHQR